MEVEEGLKEDTLRPLMRKKGKKTFAIQKRNHLTSGSSSAPKTARVSFQN